jgi:tRNA U34 5-carboxymethylaminomethyl modifying GTPase MnmE/TrmE
MSHPNWLRLIANIAEKHAGVLGEDATRELQGLAPLYDGPPRIVNLGLLNAGKSSLFNAVLQQPNRLKTGAARTTASTEEVTWGETSALLLDTPGLDALEVDALHAAQSARLQDLVVFVHSLEQGELEMGELEFLDKLAAKGVELSADYCIVVLTKNDRKERVEAEQIVARVVDQWKARLGVSPHPLCVSSQDFLDALAQGRTGRRLEDSGIPELQTWLQTRTNSLSDLREGRIWKKALQCLRRAKRDLVDQLQDLQAEDETRQQRATANRVASHAQAEELFRAVDAKFEELLRCGG